MRANLGPLSCLVLLSCQSTDKAVTVRNRAPVVTIEEPNEADVFEVGDAITFVGFVEDAESAPNELDLEWISDLAGLLEADTVASEDGELSFSTASLGEGLHTVTLKATDPGGQIGSDYMTVKVEFNCLAYTDCDYDADGHTEDDGDCNDNNPGIHPDAAEVLNGVDDNCDGVIDEGTAVFDDDGDGFNEYMGDCDDDDPDIAPLVTEVIDGIDNDCDGLIDEETDTYDDDGDGYAESDGDCDDEDPDIGPDAEEVFNGIDDDCDGFVDEGSEAFDDDGDGFSEFEGDCDDTDPAVHPEAIELCDELDNDCDGDVDDDDSDTDLDGDGFSGCSEDCDDEDDAIHPDAEEVCDEIDNDCDGETDAEDPDTDVDGDGFSVCTSEDAAVDCDDLDRFVHPDRSEMCGDGIDNDCNGEVDELGGIGGGVFYADTDADGFGDPAAIVAACSLPLGHVLNGDDCNDSDSAIKPTAVEVCDGIDNDCDGAMDDETAADASTWYYDGDGDGYGSTATVACDRPSDYYVLESGDCDDGLGSIYPGAVEVCDGVLNDCTLAEADGPEAVDPTTWYLDADGDGYPSEGDTVTACDAPPSYIVMTTGWDCDDGNSAANPGEDEQCDGFDNDCDLSVDEEDAEGCTDSYIDEDGDGYGASAPACMCDLDDVYTTDEGGDCIDSDEDVNPGTREYFTEARSAGGFDYDCNDVEEQQYEGLADACTLLTILIPFTTGWDAAEPACGETGTWVTRCDCSGLSIEAGISAADIFCDPITVERQQGCR